MAALDFSQVKGVAIPDGDVVKIGINGMIVWKAGPTNRVPLSIDTDGSIYNGTGYKDGYRVRSSGAESASDGAAITGFIKVSAGDVIRLSGWDFGSTTGTNCINAYNSSFTNLGQLTMQPANYGIFASGAAYAAYGSSSVVKESDGVWKWIVPPAASGAAYIRVTAINYESGNNHGKDMIVTINEEIT